MLKSICFSNFVKFKEYHYLDFSNDSPFIFIGENGTGKSSVLEGIRRCLKPQLSTSVSSIPDPEKLSYFICNFENVDGNKNVLSGIVTMPDELENENTDSSGNNSSDDVDNDPSSALLYQEPNSAEQQEPVPFSGENQEEEMNTMHENDTTGNTTNQQGYGCPNRENVSSAIVTVPFALENENKDSLGNNVTAKRNNEANSTDIKQNDPMPSSVEYQGDKINDMHEHDTTGNAPSQQDTNKQCFYKFVTEHFDSNVDTLLYVASRNQNDESHMFDEWRPIQSDQLEDMVKKFISTVTQKPSEENIRRYLTTIFKKQNIANYTEVLLEHQKKGKNLIESLSDQIIFTFPLHSIGPLQWTKSPRICPEMREDNYSEAEKRCEIIRYFFENGDKFDEDKEKEYFRVITQTNNKYFVCNNDNGGYKVSTPNGKYRLLKLPEGIYEAKIISILLSSKYFKTLVLEEPDRGMHSQFVNRMMQVIEQNKEDKRVILTTHNNALITPWSLPKCFVFRNVAYKGAKDDVKLHIFPAQTVVGAPTPTSFRMKKLRQLTTDHVSDIFFARKILFFEGDSELLFFSELKQHILLGKLQKISLSDSDYTQLKKTFSELTLVKMNGKGMATFCHEICKNLKLEHLVVVDRDSVCQNTENRDRAGWLQLRKQELSKGTFFWIDGDIEDMVLQMFADKPELLAKLEQEHVTLKPSLPGQKRHKSEKLFLRDKVTPQNVKSTVQIIIKNCTDTDDLYELIKEIKKDQLFIE